MRHAITVLKGSAKRWYVDNAAGGTNAGTSWTNAWTSFASISWGSISAGDILYISGGAVSKTYNALLTIGASGSAGKPITITGGVDSGHSGTVIIDGQVTRQCIDTNSKNNIVVQNLKLQNGNDVCMYVNTATAGVVIQGLTIVANGPSTGTNARGVDIHNCVGTGCALIQYNNISTTSSVCTDQTDCVYCSGSDGVFIVGNFIQQNNPDGTQHSDGIQLFNTNNVWIIANWVEQTQVAGDSNNHGMWLSDTLPGSTITVENNVVVMRNPSPAITHWNESGTWTGKALFYFNTIYHRNWGFNIVTSSTATELKCNVIYQTAGFGYVFQSWSPASASQVNYNDWFATGGSVNDALTTWSAWQAAGRDANGINLDPKFVTNGSDFHLQGTSPCIAAATPISGVTSDKDGKLRPTPPSIGAYEP